jgi:SAM-dependent methyltransferase
MDDAVPPRFVVAARATIEVVRWVRAALRAGAPALELVVPDPDASGGTWPGAVDELGIPRRSLRAWLDLAEECSCRLATPQPQGDGTLLLRLEPLGPEAPWHGGTTEGRYDADAAFALVRKLEHPGFLMPLLEALERVRPPDGGRLLVLGCHRGDELEALEALEPPPRDLEIVGVDLAAGAIAHAARRFPHARFVTADVDDLPAELGRFDLVIAIAVLQSPAVDDRALLRRLVQTHLTPRGTLLVGVPNSRFRGGDIAFGARTRNYAERDLSLVVKDLAVYRRYLHQHGFRTHVGGRYDLLLTAWRGPRSA